MKIYNWQKKILEELNNGVKFINILKGKEVGTNSLKGIISTRYDKSIIFFNGPYPVDYASSCIKTIRQLGGIILDSIFSNYLSATITYVLEDKKKIISFINCENLQNADKLLELEKTYDVIIFDGVIPEEYSRITKFIEKNKESNENVPIVKIFSPNETNSRWFIIPSIDGPDLIDLYRFIFC